EADLSISTEHAAREFVERPFEVAHADAFADGETFDLGEHPFVGRVGGFLPIALAGNNDADRWLHAFHHAYLVRRRVCAKQHVSLTFDQGVDPDGVPHVAGGVVLRDADAVEVVAVPFDFRPFGDAEPHVAEYSDKGTHCLRHGMQAAHWLRTPGERDVDSAGGG